MGCGIPQPHPIKIHITLGWSTRVGTYVESDDVVSVGAHIIAVHQEVSVTADITVK